MSNNMILVINSGSSSVKMTLIDDTTGHVSYESMAECLHDKETSIEQLLQHILKKSRDSIVAVGHRVVHGGEVFIEPTLLNNDVLQDIAAISHLAPLHNPANLAGIHVAMALLPAVPHVAVFDTAFHHTMPAHAYMYALPYDWYEKYGVRRYGFHGSSHRSVAQEAAMRLECLLQRPLKSPRLLTAHLGNGCSAAAIVGGKSIDTTMGMTPLEGLVMGTRCGDVDAGLHDYIARQTGDSLADITTKLNRESGLLGLSELSHDMRILLDAAEAGHERAILAVDVFCYRLAKSLAALAVALGQIDAVVFTGGIGEHASVVRAKTIEHLSIFGAVLDVTKNEQHGQQSNGLISDHASTFPVLVIATHEDKVIAHDVVHCVKERNEYI